MAIPNSSVIRIIHSDLKLKCIKKKRAQQLMAPNLLSDLERSHLLLDKFLEQNGVFY